MCDQLKIMLLALCLSLFPAVVAAGDISRERIKGLDEQVQDIKQDVLAISSELLQLEETLIYPSNTQVSLFVSMAADNKTRLDSVDVRLNGEGVTHHVYTHKELEALREGGVQRIYTGNVRSGEHLLEVVVRGGGGYQESASYRFTKEVGPALLEITLFGSGNPITFVDR